MRRIWGILLAASAPVLLGVVGSAPAATIDVTTFGAIPNDGVDDTTAINNAIASAGVGDTISIPAGDFTISNKIVTKSNISLSGAGEDTTQLQWAGATSTQMLGLASVSNVQVSGFTLDAENSTAPQQGIYATASSNLNLHDLAVKNLAIATGFSPHGIYFDTNVTNSVIQNDTITNIGVHSTWGAGIRLGHGSSFNQVLSNTIDTTGRGGILVDDNCTDLTIRSNTVTNSGVNGGEGLGIELQDGNDRAIVEDNHIDHWLSIDNSSNLAVRRNVITDTSGTYKYAGIELVDAHDDIFTDNTVNSGAQVGISISGPNPKTRIFFARNTINASSTWGTQIQGEKGKATDMYFYKNTFSNTVASGPNTQFAPQGHGIRFNGASNHIIFDSNTIDSNQGDGVQLQGGTLSALTFKNNTITNNIQKALDNSGVTGLVWTNNTVSGNGDNTQPAAALALAMDGDDLSSVPSIQVDAGQLLQFSPASFGSAGSGGGLAAATAGYANVLWDFGDGIPSTDFYPSHTFTTNGTYWVTMLGWDASGNGVMNVATVSVVPEPSMIAMLGLGFILGRRRRTTVRWSRKLSPALL